MTSSTTPGATTFVAEPGPRWSAIVVTALLGGIALSPLAGEYLLTQQSPRWAPRLVLNVPPVIGTGWLAIVALALICGFARSWRMGLCMDDQRVTVRNYFRTYRFAWPEVTGFVDGSVTTFWHLDGDRGDRGLRLAVRPSWALSVLGPGGRAVTATGTASGIAAPSETLAAIRQVAEWRGIAADLNGTSRARRGSQGRDYVPWVVIVFLAVVFIAVFIWIVAIHGDHCPTCGGA